MLRKHRLTFLFGLLSLASFMLWGISAMPRIARAVDYVAQSGTQRVVLDGVIEYHARRPSAGFQSAWWICAFASTDGGKSPNYN